MGNKKKQYSHFLVINQKLFIISIFSFLATFTSQTRASAASTQPKKPKMASMMVEECVNGLINHHLGPNSRFKTEEVYTQKIDHSVPFTKEELKFYLDQFYTYNRGQITKSNYRQLEPLLNKANLVQIISDILNRPRLLEEIAKKSYLHSSGFSKITLLDDWDNIGFDVRLHIWWPKKRSTNDIGQTIQNIPPHSPLDENDILDQEGRHVHRWNFVSRIISGHIEDFQYTIHESTASETTLLEKLDTVLTSLPAGQAREILRRLYLIELLPHLNANLNSISKLNHLHSLADRVDVGDLSKVLQMSVDHIHKLASLNRKFSNVLDPATGVESYKFSGNFRLNLVNVNQYQSNDLYFFPYDRAHRLSVPADTMTSTFILVDPDQYESLPGEFVYSQWGREIEIAQQQDRSIHFYSPTELKELLILYLDTLLMTNAKQSQQQK